MKKLQKGVSLLEALISLAITSFGMLGMAGMEIVAKSSNSEAIERSMAVMYASEMVDRLRVNNSKLDEYVGVTVGGSSLSTPSTNCETQDCSTTELAEFDLWSWEKHLDGVAEQKSGTNVGGLTSARACIEGPAAGGSGYYKVAVVWKGKTPLKNPSVHNCGASTSLYGTNNNLRRVMMVELYINSNG